MTCRKRHVFASFPIGTATSAAQESPTSHAWNVTKCHACHAKRQKHISDMSKKTRLCDFSHRHGNFHTSQPQNQRFPTSFLIDRLRRPRNRVFRSRPAGDHATGFPLTHVKCNKVPRLPRKTTRAQLLTRRKGHILATFPIGTATSTVLHLTQVECHKVPRLPHKTRQLQPHDSLAPHTSGRSQSATPGTQNDMTTTCDRSKRTRFYDFSQRHGNFRLTTGSNLTRVECHKVPRLPRKTT